LDHHGLSQWSRTICGVIHTSKMFKIRWIFNARENQEDEVMNAVATSGNGLRFSIMGYQLFVRSLSQGVSGRNERKRPVHAS
jgi:hypothetical protein